MRKFTYAFSIITFVLGVIFLIVNGGPNYGIDFTGGTSIQLKFKSATEPGQIRSAISGAGFGDAEIKNLGEKSCYDYACDRGWYRCGLIYRQNFGSRIAIMAIPASGIYYCCCNDVFCSQALCRYCF